MATRSVNNKIVDSVLKKLVSRFGAGYNTRGLATLDLKAISTGHDDLDVLLTKGARGVAKGCIVEILGSEGSGKTSLAMRIVSNAQKEGDVCVWFDVERAFSYALADINEVKTTELIIPNLYKDKAEEGSFELLNASEILEMLYRSVVSNIYSVVVLDSVAGLIPERVLADDFDPNSMGMAEVARIMSTMLGKIAQAAAQTETTVIFVNQLRDKPGEYYHDRFHSPGGRALKFFAHQRISVEKKQGAAGKVWIKDSEGHDQLIGHYARCTIVKNRMAPPVPPDVSIEIPIYYLEYSPDDAKRCYDLARMLQVVTMRNGVLSWKDEDTVILKTEGEADFLVAIRDQHLENRLALSCVEASKHDRNQKKKQPTRIPASVEDLANSYKKAEPIPEDKSAKKSHKKASNVATDLDDV